jgi:hypothetical protein
MTSWWRRVTGQGKPLEPEGSAKGQTTRVTIVSYIDQEGQQGTLEIPGWVGAVPHFIEARIQFTHVLGQAYVERPYSTRKDAPTELTVADLRSANGMERMFQEFAGIIHDNARIGVLVNQRLGLDAGQWEIVSTHVLKQATRH